MAESILTSTKAALGLAEDDTAFDVELIMFINSVLSRLTQIGVGPDDGFRIIDKTEEWETFLGPGSKLNMAKSYMYQRVKLLFDPPEVGFVLTAMKEMIEKDEWLLMVETDPPPNSATVVDIIIPNAFGEPEVVPVTIVGPEPDLDGVVFDGGGE